MKIQITSQNFKLTKALESFISQNMRKYLKLGQKIHGLTYKFKSHPSKRSHKSKFSCELKIEVPKKTVIVKAADNDLYKLIDQVSEKAEREIRKQKEKRRSLSKKGFIKGKKLLRNIFRR
jgi:putative sigma-54 modulation protein